VGRSATPLQKNRNNCSGQRSLYAITTLRSLGRNVNGQQQSRFKKQEMFGALAVVHEEIKN
jgi:hypothetical protein